MQLSEQLDPEELYKLLRCFLEILTEGVHRFEGTVNQYTGDGIIALFGARTVAGDVHAQPAAILQTLPEMLYATLACRRRACWRRPRIELMSHTHGRRNRLLPFL